MNPFSSQLYDFFHGLYQEIENAIKDLPPEALDWQPAPETNSIAVLVAHVCGSTRYLVGDAVLGENSNRDRPAEFRTRGLSAPQLVECLQQTDDYLRSAFERISLEDLESPRTFPRDGRPILAGWAILHALEHTANHLGHIQITTQLWGQR